MNLGPEAAKKLISLSSSHNIYLEGNILKILETDNDEFQEYITTAVTKDEEKRKKKIRGHETGPRPK